MITPKTPPRTAEKLLEALGAEPEFRDALLGDLAEEFALRTADKGDRTARRWYWGAALRVAPHLLRNWALRLRPRDVARLAGVAAAASLLVGIVVWMVLTGVEIAVERTAGPTTFPWHDPLPGARALWGMLLGITAVSTAGGWVASRLGEDRAPAVTALALGLAWATVALVAPLPSRAPLPTWYLLGQAAAVLTGTTLGGICRIATRRRLTQGRT
jgi:hypothetical protein